VRVGSGKGVTPEREHAPSITALIVTAANRIHSLLVLIVPAPF